jgi:hypothetical protein
LTKSEDRNTDDIINRPGRSTHPEAKSVLRSEATPPTAQPLLAEAVALRNAVEFA